MTDGTDAVRTAPGGEDVITILKKSFIRLSMPIFPLYTIFEGVCTCKDGAKCETPGKHPIEEWTEVRTTNTGKIHDWIDRHGRCNWGGATGKVSGVFAVDIDPRHNGVETFDALEKEYGKIPDTRIHKTGGGGVHLIFSIPRGMTIKNGSIGPGVDIKGEGGYIVLPPSRHISGGQYEVLNDVPPAEPPEWLIWLIQGKTLTEKSQQGFKMPDAIPAGERTTTLFKAARSMRAKGFSEPAVKAAIEIENQLRCEHPPVPDGKLQNIVRDASRNYSAGNIVHSDVAAIAELVKKETVIVDKKTGIVIDTKISLDNQKMVLYLIDRFSTISTGGDLWIYKDGIYTRDLGDLHSVITAVCRELNLQNQIVHVNQINSMLLGSNFYAKPPFNYKLGYLPVRNGYIVIDLETGGVQGPFPHSPENKFTYCFPVNYNPDADTGMVDKVLKQWVDPEDAPLLVQIPAQGILQAMLDDTFKKAYLLQGEKNSGKSSYLSELLPRFVGKDSNALSMVSLHAITHPGNRFATAELENKILNCHDDLTDDELQGYNEFKKYTGSTYHQIERKGRDPRNARIFCVHVFACNQPPTVPERAKYDPAFWDRWEYVAFPNTYEIDPTWHDRVFTEEFLSGFLLLVIRAMCSIYQSKKLVINHSPDEIMERWFLNSDPLSQFIDETTESTGVDGRPISTPKKYDKEKLFSFYKDWCKDNFVNQHKIISTLEKFSRDIQKFGFIPSRQRISTERKGKKYSVLVNCFIAARRWSAGDLEVEPTFPDKTLPPA